MIAHEVPCSVPGPRSCPLQCLTSFLREVSTRYYELGVVKPFWHLRIILCLLIWLTWVIYKLKECCCPFLPLIISIREVTYDSQEFLWHKAWQLQACFAMSLLIEPSPVVFSNISLSNIFVIFLSLMFFWTASFFSLLDTACFPFSGLLIYSHKKSISSLLPVLWAASIISLQGKV